MVASTLERSTFQKGSKLMEGNVTSIASFMTPLSKAPQENVIYILIQVLGRLADTNIAHFIQLGCLTLISALFDQGLV